MASTIAAWESRLLAHAHAPLDSGPHPVSHTLNERRRKLAYALCEAITQEHSRTFYLASALLPRHQKDAIRALYAFCRISDDIVDQDSGDAGPRLEQWRQRTQQDYPADDDLVAQAWADTRHRFNIPGGYAEQLLDGVTRDLKQKRYQSFAELAEYCYAVASTVGLMSMHIVGYSGKEAIPYAVKLGIALQMTNILRDVGEDWENGRLYLPLEELTAFGLTEADIARGQVDDRWRTFMRFQIERTQQLFDESLPGIALLGEKGRLAVAAAAELYRGILDDIVSRDYDVFSQRAHVSGRDKLKRLPGIWWRVKMGRYRQDAPVHGEVSIGRRQLALE